MSKRVYWLSLVFAAVSLTGVVRRDIAATWRVCRGAVPRGVLTTHQQPYFDPLLLGAGSSLMVPHLRLLRWAQGLLKGEFAARCPLPGTAEVQRAFDRLDLLLQGSVNCVLGERLVLGLVQRVHRAAESVRDLSEFGSEQDRLLVNSIYRESEQLLYVYSSHPRPAPQKARHPSGGVLW